MRQRSGIEKRGDLGLGRLQRRLGILARPYDGIDGPPDDVANLVELIQARRVLAAGQFLLEDVPVRVLGSRTLSAVAVSPMKSPAAFSKYSVPWDASSATNFQASAWCSELALTVSP